jgi:hypothetical protein
MCQTAKLFKELLICRFKFLFYFINTYLRTVFVLSDHLDPQQFHPTFEKCALVFSPVTWSIYYANAFDNFKHTVHTDNWVTVSLFISRSRIQKRTKLAPTPTDMVSVLIPLVTFTEYIYR